MTNKTESKKRILIVEDDQNQQSFLQKLLESLGYVVAGTLSSGAAAVDQWQQFNADLILMDIMMETPDAGIVAGKQIGTSAGIPIVYLTASEDNAALTRALATNPHGYLVKPIASATLKASIEVSLVRFNYERRMDEYREALEHSERLFRGIFDNLRIGYFRLTPDFKVALINPFLAELLSVPSSEDLVGWNLREVVAKDISPQVFLPQKGGEAQEMVWKTSTGVSLPVKLYTWPVMSPNGEVEYLEGTVEDMTRSNAIREQLTHSQKMKVISTLSGRVAHEINNRLTSVLGHTELIISKVEPDSKIRKYANSVMKNARSASDIISQLLSFSREWTESERPFNLVSLVQNMNDLIQHMLGKHIGLVVEIAEESLTLKGNPKAIEQAILNIAMNSRDAMSEGGKFTIKLGKAYQDAKAALPKSVPVGVYAQLTLIDTGRGMTKTVLDHLFDPFFSTKDESIASGLGLSVAQRIVNKMSGYIMVESEPGKGARFDLLFPIVP